MKQRRPISFVTKYEFFVIVLASLGVLAPVVVFILLCCTSEEITILSFQDFLSASGGVQAVIALFTFIFTAIGASAIFLLRHQVKVDAERVEMDIYRRLISAEIQSAKKLLYAPPVEQILQDLRKATENPMGNEEDNTKLFNAVREKIDAIAKSIPTPLVPLGYVSFDHIESLINEYNFLSKLLQEGRINPEFATDMGVANFQNIYQLVEPLILLRRSIRSGKYAKYASHFSTWCEKSTAPSASFRRKV